MRNLLLSAAVVVSLAISSPLASAGMDQDSFRKLSSVDVESALPNEHPTFCFLYAARLFSQGQKDLSVFWYYVGQIRFRVLFKVRDMPVGNSDSKEFTSFNRTVGQMINEYAGGDPLGCVAQIERALRWDAENVNGTTPKEQFMEPYELVRREFISLAIQLRENADKILEVRRARGLEVRR